MRWRVPPMWEDGECWVIGGGPSVPRQFDVPEDVVQDVMSGRRRPSAYSDYLSPLHDRHVIGVNNAYQIGNWIDAVFFGDCAWYLAHRQALAAFPGLKVTCCRRFDGRTREQSEGVKYLAKDAEHRNGISSDPTAVSWNSNSGAAAISLAAHFGVRRIILLGFDMALDEKMVSHWHGSHGAGSPKPPFSRHLRGFPAIAQDAASREIEILNASPSSAIAEFPKVQARGLLSSSGDSLKSPLSASKL